MRLAVMGTGYVGLVASVCLAEDGHTVTALDIDEDRVRRLRAGELPLYEPGLDELFESDAVRENLTFTVDAGEALRSQDLVLIAVGTPKREDGSCDISYVLNAADMIGRSIEQDTVVATKSTVPVGTGHLVRQGIQEELEERFGREGPEVAVASNPEFLREGSAVRDFQNPDRIVIGSESDRALDRLESLYDPFDAPLIRTGLRTAEMIKYASNAMLAAKISFINEIANVCELVGADIENVADAVGMDERINRSFLNAGIGYGGSCFPKDTEALVQIAGQGGYHSQILSAVMGVNQQQRTRFARRVIRHLPEDLADPSVGVLGLSFKPNTDDMRQAPSVDIIQELQASGISVAAYDPQAMPSAREKLSDVTWAEDPYGVLEGRNAMLLLTEWEEFLSLDFDRVGQLLSHRLIFDGRNVLPMQKLVEKGFDYYGVGRGVDRLENIVPNRQLLPSNSSEPRRKNASDKG